MQCDISHRYNSQLKSGDYGPHKAESNMAVTHYATASEPPAMQDPYFDATSAVCACIFMALIIGAIAGYLFAMRVHLKEFWDRVDLMSEDLESLPFESPGD